jgi:hypothetical protein
MYQPKILLYPSKKMGGDNGLCPHNAHEDVTNCRPLIEVFRPGTGAGVGALTLEILSLK